MSARKRPDAVPSEHACGVARPHFGADGDDPSVADADGRVQRVGTVEGTDAAVVEERRSGVGHRRGVSHEPPFRRQTRSVARQRGAV